MATDWGDGQLVLRLELPQEPDSTGQVLLKPLGLSVAGAGCDVMVPGGGVIDLQGVADPGREADLGEVLVTGPQAAALVDGLVAEVPGPTDRVYVGGSFILHMDIGDDVAAQVLDAGSGDVAGQSLLGDVIRQALDVPLWGYGGPAATGAIDTYGGSEGVGAGERWEGGDGGEGGGGWVSGGPMMRVAMCAQHHRPEICPLQH
jgi:hypothetical protein